MKPYLLIAVLLCSCSAQQRLNRLVKNHPELVKHDTLTVVDTVYFDRVEQHVTEVLLPGDTLFVDRERLHVKVVKMPGDSIYVQGVCDTLTVVREIKVPCDTVTPVRVVQRTVAPWQWVLLGLLLAVAFWVGRKLRG